MPLEFKFTCSLPNGIHARPASALEEVAAGFGAELVLTNERNGRAANAKSVLALVGADIRQNDACSLSIAGPDEQDALAALATFLREEFPRCDETLPKLPYTNGHLPLPPAFRDTGAKVRRGTTAVSGIGQGFIVQTSGLRVPEAIPTQAVTDFAAEVRKLDAALTALLAGYEEKLTSHLSQVEKALLRAHRSVARDPEFRTRLHDALRTPNRTAAGAIADAENHFSTMLLASGSALLRERALDIQDLCSQLLRQIYGQAAATAEVLLTRDSVIVAETLTPSQFLRLDRRRLKGLVLGHAGTTSHTVILARSFGIPTLTGVLDLAAASLDGQEAVVDGDLGALVTELTEPAHRYYATEQQRLAKRRAHQHRFATQPAKTPDDHTVELAGNISTAAEAVAAFEAGAQSIGLFRTEMLFLDRELAPSEAEQYEEYCLALKAAAGRPVILRTLDIGGDKPLPYLHLPPEDNPFLGYRAVRIYPEFDALFRTQIRAVVRASAQGPLKLLIPMVSSLEEVRWVKQVVKDEQSRCAAQGLPFDPAMPFGAMIEVPAAVFLLEALAAEVDFFSIGSNDLLQYFAAADRSNPRLNSFHDPLQPAFLRLLKKLLDEARAAGRWIGICGEMAAQTCCLPFLVGLGLEKISVPASAVEPLKAELASWPARLCQDLVERAVRCATTEEVRRLLQEFAGRHPAPLVESEMILLQSESASKAEAIKELVDQLYILGRTEQPRAVEQAVWDREAVYSTGFGYGFAIPHCKTSAVTASSVAMLKLRQPVAWGSLDGQPVGVILLLAIRDGEQGGGHMKILSQLARRIMHEEFREHLAREPDPAAICAFLQESLRE